jgi:hypothetical protein
LDPENRRKWEGLLALLPAGPEVPEGRLPHRSRFASLTGIVRLDGRLDRGGSSSWLRPRPQTQQTP